MGFSKSSLIIIVIVIEIVMIIVIAIVIVITIRIIVIIVVIIIWLPFEVLPHLLHDAENPKLQSTPKVCTTSRHLHKMFFFLYKTSR